MGYQAYENCLVSYYPYGKEAYESMIKEMNNAKMFIFLEYFIIEDGNYWNEIISILKKKAIMRVEVRILYDDIGSVLKLKKDYIKSLTKSGIKNLINLKICRIKNIYLNKKVFKYWLCYSLWSKSFQ